VQYYPNFFTERDVQELEKPNFIEEIKLVLKSFVKDKSPGIDGWMVKFFLTFFDLIGNDVLEAVEDSRRSGSMVSSLNLTSIALIPKVDKPSRFGDFRPISLCNLAYKIIAKIIVIILKSYLSKALYLDQFGFLKGRKILDVVGVAHECLDRIKSKQMKSLVLKLDLQKSYDCVNLDFLKLVLLKTGIGLKLTNWIMSCVNTRSFVIMVNDRPTSFFKSGRRLRKGCPLSPLIFILVMEGLNLMLKNAQVDGKISGVKTSRILKIILLLFMDDVLICWVCVIVTPPTTNSVEQCHYLNALLSYDTKM